MMVGPVNRMSLLLIAVMCVFTITSLISNLIALVDTDPPPICESPTSSSARQSKRYAIHPSNYLHTLCIVGNTQTDRLASRISSLYYPSTPAIWNLWGPDHDDLPTVTRPRLLSQLRNKDWVAYQPAPRSTWSSAIEAGVKLFQDPLSGDYDCAYFLLLDDDIDFELLSPASAEFPNVEQYTRHLLTTYQPATMWPAGFSDQEGSMALPGDEVALTTSFDNGELIVHSSIMDFVLPFAPRGEGGFDGQWTLPAIHMMLFFPSMYRTNSFMALQLRYTNKIRLSPKAVLSDGKVAIHNGSRHLYEYPQNEAYRAFLRQGMKCFQCSKFGIQAGVEQMEWTTSERPLDSSNAYRDFLPRINTFFDLLHPSVAERPWVAERNTRQQLIEMRKELSHMRLQLIVFTRERLPSLKRLLKSVVSADYSNSPMPIDLTIRVDFSPSQRLVRRYLDTVGWAHGKLTVIYSPSHLGLRTSIMNSWFPTAMDEMAVFLEDDVEVSRQYFQWLMPTVHQYYYGFDGLLRDNRVVGIALYAPIYSQMYDKPFQPKTSQPAYVMQLPCSWGALYTPRMWREFVSWFERYQTFDPLVPGLININRWAMTNSWKKYLVRFMAETGAYMIYPNVGFNQSFSTNHVEVGENEQNIRSVLPIRAQLTVGLTRTWDPKTPLPSWSQMIKYNIYEQETQLSSQLTRFPQPLWTAMDQFTVLLTARSVKQGDLANSIAYWQTMPRVREIVVRLLMTRDNPEAMTSCPRATNSSYIFVPCSVELVGASLLNRFLPMPQAKTISILSVDPHVRIGREDLMFGFYTSQMHPDQLVGFESCATSFTRTQWGNFSHNPDVISMNGGMTVASTRAAFLSPAALKAFWNSSALWTEARSLVEKAQRGEEIVMNMMLATAAKHWTLLVKGDVRNCPNPEEWAKMEWLLHRLGLLFKPWPLGQSKSFPAEWMKMWTNVPRVPRPVRLPTYLGTSWESSQVSLLAELDGKVTVILTAYQINLRTYWVGNTIETYLSTAYETVIDRVILVWNNPNERCPISFPNSKFIVVTPEKNSLNARWTHTLQHIRTAAVLNMDDDVFVDLAGIKCMYSWWMRDPLRNVGPFVRMIYPNTTYIMDDLASGGSYSVVLPRALMLGKTEVQRYADCPEQLRRYVDEQDAHCDDVLLNSISINFTTKAPLRVSLPSGSLVDYFRNCNQNYRDEVGGLALQEDRSKKRTECVRDLASAFPGWGNPLFRSTTEVGQCNQDGSANVITDDPPPYFFESIFGKKPCSGRK